MKVEEAVAPPAIIKEDPETVSRMLILEAQEQHKQIVQMEGDSADAKRELGKILLKLKKHVQKSHGTITKWLPWVQKNVPIHYRTVARCMRLAKVEEKEWEKMKTGLADLTTVSNPRHAHHGEHSYVSLSMSAALKMTSKKRPGSGGGSEPPKVSNALSVYKDRVRAVAKNHRIKAPPEAIILMLREFMSEAELRKVLDKLPEPAKK